MSSTTSTSTSTSSSTTVEYSMKDRMKSIARFLNTIGVSGSRDGLVVIDEHAVEGSNYVSSIQQLTDGRYKKSPATMEIIEKMRTVDVSYDKYFPDAIVKFIMKGNRSSTHTPPKVAKWDTY